MTTCMAGVAVLAVEFHSNADLLRPGSCLPQPQVTDMTVGLGRLQSPFAESPLDASRLKLLLEEVDLAAEGLALLVHGPVAIDFGHKAPIVNREFVELATEGGVGGSTPPESGNEP